MSQVEDQYWSDDQDDSDLSQNSDCYEEQPKGEESPMEVKNFFTATPFVRHGFGRVSTSQDSQDSSQKNNQTSVKHCIAKLNSTVRIEKSQEGNSKGK